MSVTSKALWFIETHLDDDASLEAVAASVGVSRFHLSRAFAASAGTSLARYVRSRRLSEAAKSLSAGAPDILDLALGAGYGSHEAFTRAFRQHFGLTPDQYRSQITSIPLQEPLRMNTSAISTLSVPRIVESPELLIFGLGEECREAGAASIPQQWNRFAPYIGNIPGQIGSVTYGAITNFDHGGGYLYIAGVEVKSFPADPPEFTRLRIPSQTYAVFEHREHVTAIVGTWKAIWEHGLTDSGYQAVEGPSFERYGPEFNGATGLGGFEIWVPVRPLDPPGALRLSMAMLFVKDLPRMAEFYTNVMGLAPIAATRGDNYVEFESGFALHAIPEAIAANIAISDPPQPREKAPTKLFFAAPNVAAESARLKSLGVSHIDRPWGSVEWLDPEGNIFALRPR
ncbi:MAG: helix-turn-helix domain-containing protein [Acidobacteriota bacterium]